MNTRSLNGSNVTLADVAKAAGVSKMTISRYLHNHPNVTDRTVRRVKAALAKTGYRPNHAARMLMGQPSMVLGLIVPNLANPFFSSIAHSVQQMASAHGYLVWIAATNHEIDSDLRLIERMREHHVDGILLISSPTTSLKGMDLAGLPLVALDRPVRGAAVDFVTTEDRLGARDAVTHLLGHGYERIACLGLDRQLHTIHERIVGYEEAMREHHLSPLRYVCCEDKVTAVRVLRKLLSAKRPVQALFTLNSTTTIAMLEALDEMHCSVPNDVAFFSFGDFPLADVYRPRISTVRQPTEELGEQATKLLIDLITSQRSSFGKQISVPASLIIRQSCGCTR